jgi:hypothetical protein
MEMSHYIFYPATHSPALLAAAETLKRKGYGVVSRPCESVTHLLLPVPSFEAGRVKGGWKLESILAALPGDITVVGGNLNHPALGRYRTIDLMQDAFYVTQNADITAHCAVKLALSKLPVTLKDQKVLVVGWGRIGKCLAQLLREMGAEVAVQARKESDRAMLAALGYLPRQKIDGYRVIFTKQDETADARIESMMVELGPDYNIRVVTGDRLLQYSAVHSGILRMTAGEFEAEVTAVANEIADFVRKLSQKK